MSSVTQVIDLAAQLVPLQDDIAAVQADVDAIAGGVDTTVSSRESNSNALTRYNALLGKLNAPRVVKSVQHFKGNTGGSTTRDVAISSINQSKSVIIGAMENLVSFEFTSNTNVRVTASATLDNYYFDVVEYW